MEIEQVPADRPTKHMHTEYAQSRVDIEKMREAPAEDDHSVSAQPS